MSGNKNDQFAIHAAAVARDLFGEENKQLSTPNKELRFGNHGSISVDVKAGQFYDHQEGEGGGVLWAIQKVKGLAGADAVEWMRANGYDIEDNRPTPPPRQNTSPARLDPDGNWLPQRVPDHGRLTKTYDYRTADGELSYQVCRYDWTDPENPKGHSKTFVQRRPDAKKANGWAYKMDGVTWLPYRLPELLEDIRGGYEIFVVEGEKKVDMLRDAGIPATCNHGGAGKFPDDLVDWFKGARLILMPDNDDAGRDHMDMVARKVGPVAKSVKKLAIPGLPPKGGIDDWLPSGGSADQLYDLAARAEPYGDVAYKSQFGAVRWLDFDAPGPTYEYMVKGVLTENEISMLLGESQSGKSFIAIEIAMSVARGVPFFGHQVRKGGVIYQAGESATGVRRRRFPAYARHHDVGRADLPIVLLERPVDFYTSDEQVDQFIEECRYWASTFDDPLKLIIIDTFNKATPGANENDGKDMGMVLARCDRVRRATGAHVMLVHHLNAGGTKARGHTSLFGNVENVVTVRRVPDSKDADGRAIREWVLSKAKDGEDGISKKFVLRQVHLGQDSDGDAITSCVVQPPEGATVVPDDPDGIFVTGFNATILRAVYVAIQTKGVIAPQALGLGRGAMAVEKRDLQSIIKDALDASDDDDIDRKPKPDETEEDAERRRKDKRRKDIQRAREHLYAKGVIAQRGDWTWLTGKKVKGFEIAPGLSEEDHAKAQRRKGRAEDGLPPDDRSGPIDLSDLPFDAGDFQ